MYVHCPNNHLFRRIKTIEQMQSIVICMTFMTFKEDYDYFLESALLQ